jgi:GDP-L-fucose synthase
MNWKNQIGLLIERMQQLFTFIKWKIESINHFNRLPFVMNVGIGFDYSVLEYYKAVADAFSWKGKFKFDLSKPVGQKQKLVSIKKLNDFGWQNRTGLEKAINETIRFFSKGNKDVI